VADTTLDFDTTTKAGLYARAGIADYWVLDVNKRRIIVHREPMGGKYCSLAVYEAEEAVSPLAAPGASLRWIDLETER
jgi:Uma2 family endonuclease